MSAQKHRESRRKLEQPSTMPTKLRGCFEQFIGGLNPPEPWMGRGDLFVLLIYFPVLVAVFFLPLMGNGRVLSPPHGDIPNYWYPMRAYLGHVLRQGHIPYWNPYIQSGTPFLAANQSGIFYPLNWLFAFMSTGSVFNIQILISFWAGLAAMHVLVRRLGRSLCASATAALVFGFSGFAVLHWVAGHVVFVTEWPFTPLAVLAWVMMQGRCEEGGRRLRCLGPMLGMSGSLAFQYFSGHPQIVYFTLVLLAQMQIGWLIYSARRRNMTPALVGLGWLCVAIAVTGGLLLVQTLPTLLHTRETVRATNIGMTYYEDQSQPLSNVITIFAPWAWGGRYGLDDQFCSQNLWEVNNYVGAVACVLALICFMVPFKARGLHWTCVVAVVLASWLALGGNAGLYRLLFHVIPGLSLFRDPGRILYVVVFNVALLTASGFDLLAEWAVTHAREFRLALMRSALVVLSATLLFVYLFRQGAATPLFRSQLIARAPTEVQGRISGEIVLAIFDNYYNFTLIALGTASIVLGLLWLFWVPRLREKAQWAVLLLLTAELLTYGWPYRASFSPSTMNWPGQVTERLQSAGSLYRMGSLSITTDINHAMIALVRHVWGYEPTGTHRYATVMLKSQNINLVGMAPAFLFPRTPSPFLDALAMRFVLSPGNLPPGSSSWRVVSQSEDRVLYENPAALPRAFTVSEARSTTADDVIAAVTSPGFRPSRLVLIEGEVPASEPEPAAARPPGMVVVQQDDAELFAAEVSMTRAGWFVLMDQLLPGWTVTVDGKPSMMFRANAIGRALHLGNGTHQVVMKYRAPGFRSGAMVSGLAWSGWLAGVIYVLARRYRSRSGRAA